VIVQPVHAGVVRDAPGAGSDLEADHVTGVTHDRKLVQRDRLGSVGRRHRIQPLRAKEEHAPEVDGGWIGRERRLRVLDPTLEEFADRLVSIDGREIEVLLTLVDHSVAEKPRRRRRSPRSMRARPTGSAPRHHRSGR
jgi:hypothetical protein